ncbi:BCCT family transporter [Brevibacterium paucivorans]|uniref:Choline transporter n=1 Tax=Brevibacterium paucivorans TaxID=170994 RepID=A0A2N6VM77_9MICO|nr:BCCT family transporter [Brevibacterium paucivorans]PMD05251.1 choline transporter [Brevibacterium paucivorans]
MNNDRTKRNASHAETTPSGEPEIDIRMGPKLQEQQEKAARKKKVRQERSKKAKRFIEEIEYPHGIHPALVPGVSIEDQLVRYRVDKGILVIVGLLIVGFVAWGIAAPEQVLNVSSAALQWVMGNLGWIFNGLAIVLVIFLLCIAFSRYGRIPLGLDGEKPEFSTGSWAAMLFAAGIGIAIIFFGPYEPLQYFLDPRPGAYDPATVEAIKGAMAQAALHWGVNAWAIYAIVGLTVAYMSFRRGRLPLMSSVLEPLFGKKSDSLGGRIIDSLAIVATLFGTASSLGLGSLQIARGAQIVTGWNTTGNTVAIVIIMVLTIGTILSAVSGVTKGIRRLSNINMVMAVGLAVFFFVAGPTVFLVNIIPGVIVDYFATAPEALSATMADSPEMQEFLSTWTTFYWAWWVSWSPFVGVFTAKISRGRTIRQFVLGVLFIPSSIIILAFTILGGTAIYLQHKQQAVAPDGTIESLPKPESIFFTVLDYLPGAALIAPVVMVMLAIFFITTADSASLVNAQLTQGGNPKPNRLITAFWALCMAGIAVVMLLVGGESALTGLQNFITVTALPFTFVIVLMCVGLVKDLRNDPQTLRANYTQQALKSMVRRGIEKHGDDFAISIEPTSSTSKYAAGATFDSKAEDLTAWYQRTDEDGNPVNYDYSTGEYLDDNGDPIEVDSSEESASSQSSQSPQTSQPTDEDKS